MTPTREKYLKSYGNKEKFLRERIQDEMNIIKDYKWRLNNDNQYSASDREFALGKIAVSKIKVSIYRYELNRFKSFDRVVEPKIVPLPPNPKGQKNVTVCKKCGTKLIGPLAIHCPGCGRYIMWWRLRLDG